MDFKDLVKVRRSYRTFSGETVSDEDIRLILRAALMSPSAKRRRNWQFVVVRDKALLEAMSKSKESGAAFVAEASAAILILGVPAENDCWVEDCSIAAVTIQYQAEDLGLATCWAHLKDRGLDSGEMADDILKTLLNIPDNQQCLCIIAVGHKVAEQNPQNEDALLWSNISYR